MSAFFESIVEDAALAWLESIGWVVQHGPTIAPGELAAKRSDYAQVVSSRRSAASWNTSPGADKVQAGHRRRPPKADPRQKAAAGPPPLTQTPSSRQRRVRPAPNPSPQNQDHQTPGGNSQRCCFLRLRRIHLQARRICYDTRPPTRI